MAASRKTINWFEWARALGALAIVCLHAVVSTTNVPEIASANQALLYAENLAAYYPQYAGFADAGRSPSSSWSRARSCSTPRAR